MLSLLLACAAPPDSVGAKDSGADSALQDSDTSSTGTRDDRYFPDGAPWYEDVSAAAVDSSSPALISALQAHGWGGGNFQIDFSLTILSADASTPREEFTPTDDFYTPDCDHVPMPVPDDGNLEGESGYACQGDGDCHLLVAERDEQKLYEMWRADIRGDQFRGGCLAVWEMDRVYPEDGRGDQCTSADAAGYPIAPLLFTSDEVAAGAVEHAIRFILPNDAIRDGEFVHPATHATNSEGGGAEAIPYGAHLRLKPDFDLTRIEDPEARVVAVGLQKYGMFLADGGNIALTAAADTRNTAKWEDLFDSHALFAIEPQDFEVLELGAPVPLTFECERN